MTTVPFTINQLPRITKDSSGNIISVVLKNGPIFNGHMTQITVQSNGSSPTQGTLIKAFGSGVINATATEFSQVSTAAAGMQAGDQRTLEIVGTDNGTSFSVTGISIDVPGARLTSHITSLLGPADETGTGTEG